MKKLLLIIGIALQCSFSGFSQSTFSHFTDAELIKLASHIKKMKTTTSNSFIFTELGALNKKSKTGNQVVEVKNQNPGRLTDSEIIRLANYVRSMELCLENSNMKEEANGKVLAEIQTDESITYVLSKQGD